MAISFFEILSDVLQRDINHLAQTTGSTVSDIYERMVSEAERNQAEWYSNRVPNLNYQNPDCRLAYLYIVAAANAATFHHVLSVNPDLEQYIRSLASTRGRIRLCAFGAGPGTELLALAKWFDEAAIGQPVGVDFQLLDRVEEWANSWYGIREAVCNAYAGQYGTNPARWPMVPAGNFLRCDVTSLARVGNLGSIWNQDVYVLNFLLSEVFNDDPGLRAFIRTVALQAPSGARFVFIERRGGMWEARMSNIAREAGLLLSPFVESKATNLGAEKPELLGPIYTALSERKLPRLTWNVVYSIGVKQ